MRDRHFYIDIDFRKRTHLYFFPTSRKNIFEKESHSINSWSICTCYVRKSSGPKIGSVFTMYIPYGIPRPISETLETDINSIGHFSNYKQQDRPEGKSIKNLITNTVISRLDKYEIDLHNIENRELIIHSTRNVLIYISELSVLHLSIQIMVWRLSFISIAEYESHPATVC